MMLQVLSLPMVAPAVVALTRTRGRSNRVYVYRWKRHERKGQHCKVLARGTMNSCLVRFDDAYTMVTSRNAIKKWLLPAETRAPIVEIRNALAPLRCSDSPRAPAATVLVQGFDEALQTPGALADVMRQMPANLKRFADPTMSPDALPMKSAAEIAAALGCGDDSAH